jgi:hypothetical protein
MWRLLSASGDIRQRLEHDIRQQEKDDKTTVNTYQNKLNSQSYRRLSKPTMTGRPTFSRPSKSVRLLGARSTVECQLSPGQSETQQAVGKRWASVESGRRLWSGKMRNATNNSGHPGLVLLLRCLGVGKARVDSKGSEDCELPWQGACVWMLRDERSMRMRIAGATFKQVRASVSGGFRGGFGSSRPEQE